MRPRILIGAIVFSGVLTRAQPLAHSQALDDGVFQNCDEVLSRATALSADIHEPAYIMELFPKGRGTLARLFPSEVTAAAALEWIASHDTKSIPYALFYFLKGAYTLRCRDNGGHYLRLSGPVAGASPLDLELASGKAEISYFYLTSTYRNAFVLMVTEVPLESLSALDEVGLMARVKELLNARFVQSIYIRNDPWFLGTAQNSLNYLFADSFKRITLQEYLATKTLECNGNMVCRFRLIY